MGWDGMSCLRATAAGTREVRSLVMGRTPLSLFCASGGREAAAYTREEGGKQVPLTPTHITVSLNDEASNETGGSWGRAGGSEARGGVLFFSFSGKPGRTLNALSVVFVQRAEQCPFEVLFFISPFAIRHYSRSRITVSAKDGGS